MRVAVERLRARHDRRPRDLTRLAARDGLAHLVECILPVRELVERMQRLAPLEELERALQVPRLVAHEAADGQRLARDRSGRERRLVLRTDADVAHLDDGAARARE